MKKKYLVFDEMGQSIRSLFWGFWWTCLFFGLINFWFMNGIAGYFQQLEPSRIEAISDSICETLHQTETQDPEFAQLKKALCPTNDETGQIAGEDIEIVLAFGGGKYPIEQVSKAAWDELTDGKFQTKLSASFEIHGQPWNWYKSFFYYPDRTFPTTEQLANELLSCRSFRMYLGNTDQDWCPQVIQDRLGLNNINKKLQKKLTENIDKVMNGTSQYKPGLRKGTISAYNMRRVWNGLIQWLTVWLALSGLAFLWYRKKLYQRERCLFQEKMFVKRSMRSKKLKLIEKEVVDESKIPLFVSDFLAQRGLNQQVAINDPIFKEYVDSVNKKLYSDAFARRFNIVRIVNTVNQACLNDKNEGIQILDSEINQTREEMSSRGFFSRFVIFAVPTIGFVGTVLGISEALGGADKVLSAATEPLQISAIQSMTVNLSLAFDTTLVALLLSIPLTLFSEILIRRDDENLTLAYQVIMDKNIEHIKNEIPDAAISDEEFEAKVEAKVKGIIQTELTQLVDKIHNNSINTLLQTMQQWAGQHRLETDKQADNNDSQTTTTGQ